MKFIQVNNVALHYLYRPSQTSGTTGGTEAPTLVFLNSLGSDLRIWHDVVAQLAGHHSTLCYDKRGHGLSDAPAGPYTLADFATDLLGLLDHLAIKHALLVGVSVGGMIAQQFALAYPNRVAGLVLCDTGAKIGTAAYWAERATAVRATGLAPLEEAILTRWFSSKFRETAPAAYRGYANMLTRTPQEGYAATCDALRAADLRAAVPAISAPTLVLCGDEDLATPPALGKELAAAIPNARFALIEQAGHIPFIEQPNLVVAHIKTVFDEVKAING